VRQFARPINPPRAARGPARHRRQVSPAARRRSAGPVCRRSPARYPSS